ncbi:MAG: outer membrane lipoprotein-sorting protein [Gammaproteobacteria bacterium]|nr:MAG: outer membrane lipoprotein-sorting protein [Gammaproteobacteria bacterium]
MKTITKKLPNKHILAAGFIAAAFTAAPTLAKVSPEEASKIGTTLTAVGAEKAGNADGTIPAYTGGLTQTPACHKSGSTFLCNPYPDDKPLFTITADNYQKYKDKLAAGHIALFERYKTFKMPVYQTRRSAAVPEMVHTETKSNATSTTLADNGNGLKNFQSWGVPFPIPQDGLETIWNHIVRHRGTAVKRLAGQATPQPNGSFNIVLFEEEIAFRRSLSDMSPGEDDNLLFYFKQQVKSPPRLAGNVLLVHETIDQVKEPRKAWIYNAGQRRVRRAPQVAYDGPGTASDGLRTSDNFDLYNGSPDRYDWKLVGKKEIYIPYNSFKLDEKGVKYTDIIKPNHLNPELTRYELHRVWVVEATLKSGTRHIYNARTFYIDEDTWQAGVIDLYDGRGNLWRVQEAHAVQYYNAKVPWYAVETVYDLQNGRYLALGLENEESRGVVFGIETSKVDWKPQALRRAGRR